MVAETLILKRIEMMQEELKNLKKAILDKGAQKPDSLRGIWEGVDFSDEEIEQAKRSWLKE